ncbi:multicopper oxidase domain-containing protein [Ornithinicoccus hortensis]|uniref:Copper-containing nitrite reductase n=1 Tax=Ornithinicoccus hortensis TaxID=82346 RepID=A0A542YMC5_9MICO|nr:multicopper oxidase domain-containing protein [Ornithinicoccus hortensis]TQL49240.1 nitrite reductase (NO-forming) [Ornithinicoccus hortensis]
MIPVRPSTSTQAPGPAPSRGTWALRDRTAIVWLLAAVVIALVHPFVPESRWLMVHLVLLGALTHSIMVWTHHFAQALLKTPPGLDDRRRQSQRLVLLLVGVATVLVGVPTGWWPVTVTGAVLVTAAVTIHGIQLWRRLRAALPGRFRVTIRYYLCSAACLPVGILFGVLLARGPSAEWHGRFLLAHTMLNVLGWIGLTVTGTLVTLWPTMLRTRMDDRAEHQATRALPVLVTALVVLTGGALLDVRVASAAGLVLYAVGLVVWGRALVRPARTRPPREFATASVGAALVWWVVGIGWLAGATLTSADWTELTTGFGPITAVLVVGFAAQLLPGALSYLIPSVLGGGPSVVRAGQRWFDRWGTARLVVINLGLPLCLLPVPSAVRVTVSALVLVALAAFIPLMLAGAAASVRAKRAVAQEGPAPARGPRGPVERPSVWSAGQLVAALSAVAVMVALGVGFDPAAAGLGSTSGGGPAGGAAAGVEPTGQTTTVRVSAQDMRFVPDRVEVPAGDRLVVELVNDDPSNVHDLTLGGQTTPRLSHGDTATLDLGVVGTSLEGWCTIIGHRQMGMVFSVDVVGDAAGSGGDGAHAGHGATGDDAQADPPATGEADGDVQAGPTAYGIVPDPDATVASAVDPVLPPLGEERVHRLTLTAQEVELEVAPGVWQRRWTFNGQVPGPTLHGRVGDTFEITLVNDGTMGHSIDFHAGALAPDEPMRTIAPGESLEYTFTAGRAGIWMYHCSTMPMSSHIAAGMFGAVVIEPDDLAPVDRSYLLVQSETYLDTLATTPEEATDVDPDKVAAEVADAVSFNGIAFQYDQEPLTATVGERVRIWVLDAGPNRSASFHVVGGQFDTVYLEGAYRLREGRAVDGSTEDGGSQVLGLFPAQGGFVELTFPEAGHYPFVSHLMVDAERGAHGIVQVTD